MKYPRPIIIFALLVVTFAAGYAIGTHYTSSSKGFSAASPVVAEPYYHSYKEMQVWAGVEPDGHWGPISNVAYRAKRDRVYNDKMAMETWTLGE